MNRDRLILKNVSTGIIFKILNLTLVYLSIPFLIRYLGNTSYGIWVTIFSIINMVLFIDGGLANGLKTKLSISISNNDYNLAKKYIATSYISISLLSLLLFCIGIIFIYLVSLSSFLEIQDIITETKIKNVFFITLIFVCTNFILSLYKSLFYANQQASFVEKASFANQLIIFILIYIALQYFEKSLTFVAYIYGTSNFLISVLFSFIFFKKNKKLLPKLSDFDFNKIKELLSLSTAFFIIQLCMIIIFTTDSVLITRFLGPKEVTNYDVIVKTFQLLITFSLIILDPFWASFSDAFNRKDFNWIQQTFKKLNKLFLVLCICTGILIFLAPDLIKFWINNNFSTNNLLIYSFGIFVLVRVYGLIYMYFLNGIGKIKLQMILYIIGAIINIPISIILMKYYNLGSSGVIIGTTISIISMSIILPLQTKKTINEAINFNNNSHL